MLDVIYGYILFSAVSPKGDSNFFLDFVHVRNDSLQSSVIVFGVGHCTRKSET